MFVDGLAPAILALLAGHREQNHELTYPEILHYAQAEGDAFHAWQVTNPKSRKVLFLYASESSNSQPTGSGTNPNQDNIHYVYSHLDSVGTLDLPSTSVASSDSDGALDAAGNWIPEAHVLHARRFTRFSRTGWMENIPKGRVDN